MFGNRILSQLTVKLAELYKEVVTTTVQFDELRRYTRESLDEFKRLIERQSDKIDRIERERISAEAETTARIKYLESRLDLLSEKALHVAMSEMAAEYAKRGRNGSSDEAPPAQRLTDGA